MVILKKNKNNNKTKIQTHQKILKKNLSGKLTSLKTTQHSLQILTNLSFLSLTLTIEKQTPSLDHFSFFFILEDDQLF